MDEDVVSHLDDLEKLETSHLRHPVISNDHVDIRLLPSQIESSIKITETAKNGKNLQVNETDQPQQLQRLLTAVHGRHCMQQNNKHMNDKNISFRQTH